MVIKQKPHTARKTTKSRSKPRSLSQTDVPQQTPLRCIIIYRRNLTELSACV